MLVCDSSIHIYLFDPFFINWLTRRHAFFHRTIHKLHRRWTFCENEWNIETTTAAAAALTMAGEKNIKTTAKKRNTMIS